MLAEAAHKTTFHPCHVTTSLFTFSSARERSHRISLLAFYDTKNNFPFSFRLLLILSIIIIVQQLRDSIRTTHNTSNHQMVVRSARILVNESTGNFQDENHRNVCVELMIINFNGLSSHLGGFSVELESSSARREVEI